MPSATTAQPLDIRPVPASMRAQITVTNTLIGAAIGGTRAWLTHRPIRRGVILGASGGLLTSAGRQVIATRGTAAGLSGRLLHDVGLGIGSAAQDSALTIPFHVGPLVARWTPSSHRLPSVRVNVTNLVVSTQALIDARGRVDWGATLWSGAFTVLPPVRNLGFNSDYSPHAGPGTITLAPFSSICRLTNEGQPICRLDLSHESIHVLQIDMLHEWIGRPLENAALRQSKLGRTVGRFVEIGLLGPAAGAATTKPWPYHRQWAESEAFWLTEGFGPPRR